jgi:hypothetical protein
MAGVGGSHDTVLHLQLYQCSLQPGITAKRVLWQATLQTTSRQASVRCITPESRQFEAPTTTTTLS